MTPELQAVIDHDRTELSGDFCRSCGYCLPCAAGIDIPQAARMAQLLRRAPYKPYLSDEWREKMHQIKNCIHCNACKSRCPYGLDTRPCAEAADGLRRVLRRPSQRLKRRTPDALPQ